jgi:subtilisin-like proprotein convertase family protein
VTVNRTSQPSVAIPDYDTAGIRDRISGPTSGTVKDIRVSIQITHRFLSDLRITLLAPYGDSVVLYDRQYSPQHELAVTYDNLSLPALNVFSGRPAQGDWTLWVQDVAFLDVGRLEKWQLEFVLA